MDESNLEKKKFIADLSGRGHLLDCNNKTIYLFDLINPTRIGSLTSLEYKRNQRNTWTGFKDNIPVLDVINNKTFRLLDGWTIAPESRNNIISCGWTEETNDYITHEQVKVRKFNKYLVIQFILTHGNAIHLPDIKCEMVDRVTKASIETYSIDTLFLTPEHYQLLNNQPKQTDAILCKTIVETTDGRLTISHNKTCLFYLNIDYTLRDGTLIDLTL